MSPQSRSQTTAKALADIDNLIACAVAYRADVAKHGPSRATFQRSHLTLLRAVNAVEALYTDELHERIAIAADEFCEDASGEFDPWLAVERARDAQADRGIAA
jgi:hypothetical protein